MKATGLEFKIMEMAKRIAELREIVGLSTAEMALKTGVTEKEYLVRVEGIVTKDEVKKLSEGVIIDGGYKTRKCKTYIESIDHKNKSSLIGIVLQEGKKHQVKNMVEAIGHKAKRLTRIRFGCISIEALKEGEIRELTIHEIKTLLVDAATEKDYSYKKVRRV